MGKRYIFEGFSAAIDWFTHASLRHGNEDQIRRARLTVTIHWTLISLALLFAVIMYSLNCWIGSAALCIGVAVACCGLLSLRWTASSFFSGNLLTGAYFVVLTVLAIRLGGHGSPALPWYATVPVVALTTAGRRSAVFWLVVMLSTLIAFYTLDYNGYSFPNDLAISGLKLLDLLAFAGVVMATFSLAFLYDMAKDRTLRLRQQAEDKLRSEKELSDDIINSLPGLFYILRKDRLVRWNKKFEEVTGYSAEEIGKMRGPEFFDGVDKDIIKNKIVEVFLKGAGEAEAELVTKNGKKIPFYLTGQRNMFDGHPHLVGLGIDITKRKQTETELSRAKNEAEAATIAKSEFLANMSHEIRTPMTAILGFSDILIEKSTTPEQLEAATTIKQNGNYLIAIINDILDLSKIEAGKLEVERLQCSPLHIVAEVVSLMRVRANAKNLLLEIDYQSAIPQTIQSDPIRLRQILINLIGNAIKFTEAGVVRLVVRLLDDDPHRPQMQFQIVDTGIGMTAEQMADLFKPFSQVDASVTRRNGGTGLGLAISKRLAGKLGGDITVSSALGEGSTFTVTIDPGPLDGVKMLTAITEAELPVVSEEQPEVSHFGSNYRVLLAEDGYDNQRLITFLLERAGAEVVVVNNGALACEKALAAQEKGNRFDVIVMDMQMPNVDGYEATRRLRQEGYTGPIIALTAHAMSKDREKCLDAGCNDYATKPIDRNKLLSLVAKYAASQDPICSNAAAQNLSECRPKTTALTN